MSIQPADMSRRVVQLREDLDATYDLLKVVERTQKQHGKRLDRIEVSQERLQSQVGEVQSQVGEVQTQVGEVQTKVGEVQTQVGEVQTQVGGLQLHVTEHGQRLGRIEGQLTHVVRLLEARP